ncbi:hypothetical protein I4U23_012208 [Adineta vaga]|nr:hypothetical protein I4U23_012208 [Adineta vaga]
MKFFAQILTVLTFLAFILASEARWGGGSRVRPLLMRIQDAQPAKRSVDTAAE